MIKKNSIFLIIFLFLFCGCRTIQQEEHTKLIFNASRISYTDMVVSDIISVYDGDTFRANLTSPKGLSDIISKNISIRLLGIDTPEIRGSSRRLTALAKKAKYHTENRLKNADVIILTNVKRGMYFRILAIVIVDGVNLNQELIDKGYAHQYDGTGNKKHLWDKRYKRYKRTKK